MGKLIGFAALMSGFCYLYNKIRIIYKIQKNKKLLKNSHYKKQKEYLAKIRKCDIANAFSICLSIDYKVNKKSLIKEKTKINSIIYSQIATHLKKYFPKIKIEDLKDTLIVISDEFNIYDKTYEIILSSLSKFKAKIDKKYNVCLIPSITTDAHIRKPDTEEIKEDHKNIKNCNLNNTACTTKTFYQHYKYLNKSRYIGIPIGEYGVVGKEKDNIYELNMVHKDLSSQLERMGH